MIEWCLKARIGERGGGNVVGDGWMISCMNDALYAKVSVV